MVLKEQAYIAGYFVGDGCASWKKIKSGLCLETKLYSSTADRARLRPRLEALGIQEKWRFYRKNCPVLAHMTLPAAQRGFLFDLLDLTKFPRNKQFDVKKIFDSGVARNFLMGLWDADGCVRINIRKGRKSPNVDVTFRTTHRTLAQNVSDLLALLGVESSLHGPDPRAFTVYVPKRSHSILRGWAMQRYLMS